MWFAMIMALCSFPPAPDPQANKTFPANTREWQINDAFDELLDRSPVARNVAVLRLKELGFQATARDHPLFITELFAFKNKLPDPATNAHPRKIKNWACLSDLRWDTPVRVFEAIPTPLQAWRRLGISLSTAVYDLRGDIAVNLKLLRHYVGIELFKARCVDAANHFARQRLFASEALPDLIRAVNDPSPIVRAAAQRALCEPGTPLPVELYLSLLTDSDPELRTGALRMLYAYAPNDPRFVQFHPDPPARQAILAGLRSDKPEQRVRSATHLAEEHLVPKPVADALVKAVSSGDFVVRQGLILGIDRAWADGKEVETMLQTIQQHDPDPAQRTYAKAALRAIASGKDDQQ